jgi:parallel beta-helix repeat protein
MRFARCCAAAAAASLGFAAPAFGSGAGCGATLKTDTKLRADIAGCTGDGLVIGADRITVDLRGHTLSGSAAGAGIRLAGHRGVTVVGGTITGFANGVLLDDGDGNVLRDLAVRSSAARGVQLQNGSDGNRLERVDSSQTARTGFALLASSRNTLVRVSARENPFNGAFIQGGGENVIERGEFARDEIGIGIEDSAGNRLTGNTVLDSFEAGINILGAENAAAGNRLLRSGAGFVVIGDGNAVVANRIEDTIGCDGECGMGISVEGGRGNLVTANLVERTLRMGIRVDEYEEFDVPLPVGTVIRANIVRDAGTDGISVATDSAPPVATIPGTRIEANLVEHSAGDGILVLSPATALAYNLALRNAMLGIEAVGARDGGGNHARFNGDPRQCLGVAC